MEGNAASASSTIHLPLITRSRTSQRGIPTIHHRSINPVRATIAQHQLTSCSQITTSLRPVRGGGFPALARHHPHRRRIIPTRRDDPPELRGPQERAL